MKADPFQIGDVLKNPKRFVVPIYQRTYAWRISPHLETFFDQVEAKAELRLAGAAGYPHYMGALLVIPRPYEFGRLEVIDVVDGQQRLTTFQIFAAALRDLAQELGEVTIADLILPCSIPKASRCASRRSSATNSTPQLMIGPCSAI